MSHLTNDRLASLAEGARTEVLAWKAAAREAKSEGLAAEAQEALSTWEDLAEALGELILWRRIPPIQEVPALWSSSLRREPGTPHAPQ